MLQSLDLIVYETLVRASQRTVLNFRRNFSACLTENISKF